MMSFVHVRPGVSRNTGMVISSRSDMGYLDSRLAEDHRVFSPLFHESEIHVPIAVLDVSEDDGIQGALSDCLDMPIRMKGQVRYSIPQDWASLIPAIQQIVNIEHTNNSNWSSYYTYLSIHYTPSIKEGDKQRHAGCHTDGFQGAREPVRTRGSRSYVAVTNGGTRYFPQTFIANLDPTKYNVFEGFDLQVQRDDKGEPVFEVARENEVYFFDAYTVHESGAAARDGARLFIRLTWEMKLFDRAGNTKNAMLDYDWEPVDYDIRSDLATPSLDDLAKAQTL